MLPVLPPSYATGDRLLEYYPRDIETSLGDEMVQFASYAVSDGKL